MHKTRTDRQLEAAERQLARSLRSDEKQLRIIRLRDLLNERGGKSAKKTARLRMRALERAIL